MVAREPHCVCHHLPAGCDQGRQCPFRETEASNVIPLRPEFPAPKGKPVNYRSSNNTLRFHRTLSDALGCSPSDPVYPMPDNRPGLFARLLTRLFGR